MTIDTNTSASYVSRAATNDVLLIDADFLKYYVSKDVYDWIQKNNMDPIETYGIDYLSYFVFKRIDDLIISKINAKAYVFLFSGSSKNTFRWHLAVEKEYKGNRKPSDSYDYENKWRDMAEVMHVIKERYTVFMKDNMEADDLASILSRSGTCIYSQDKDLKQIIGRHWDIKMNKPIEIGGEAALMFLSYQLLAGDTGDNIPGFPGMGEKKTTDFLAGIANVKNMPTAILKHYMTAYGLFEGIDRFVENWSLLKLRTSRGAYLKELLATEIETINHLIKS